LQPSFKQCLQTLVLATLLALSLNAYGSRVPRRYNRTRVVDQTRAKLSRPAEDRVIIQRRRTVLTRPPKIASQLPHRKTAVVVYPVLAGLSDPAVLRKVRSAISFKNIFDYSLDEYRNDSWLSEFSYVVNYNRDYMLDISFTQSGMGAYPDEQQKHFLIDLRDGHVVKATDVFESGKLGALSVLVDRELQREIQRLSKENANSNESEAGQKESMLEAYENLKFEVQNLDDFVVGAKGITFLYDAGFPHMVQAGEPEGRYFFTYAALSDYIKRDGLLGRFKR
jgi:hypothetical protein